MFLTPFPALPALRQHIEFIVLAPPFPRYSYLGQAIEFIGNQGVLAPTPLDTKYLKPARRPFLAGPPAGEPPYGAIAGALTDARL